MNKLDKVIRQRDLKNPPYNKIPECVYPYKYRCRWCEYNVVPELSDGGCKLSKHPATDNLRGANNESK